MTDQSNQEQTLDEPLAAGDAKPVPAAPPPDDPPPATPSASAPPDPAPTNPASPKPIVPAPREGAPPIVPNQPVAKALKPLSAMAQETLAILKNKVEFIERDLAIGVSVIEKFTLDHEKREAIRRIEEIQKRDQPEASWPTVSEAIPGRWLGDAPSASSRIPERQRNLLELLNMEGRSEIEQFPLNESDVEESVRELTSQHFSVVKCWHDPILLDLEYRIAARFSGGAKLILPTKAGRADEDPVTLGEVLAWHYESQQASQSSTQITFIHVAEQSLAESLDKFMAAAEFRSHYCAKLKTSGGRVVCFLFLNSLGDVKMSAGAIREVNWLQPILHKYSDQGVDVSSPKEVVVRLAEQRRRRLWPADSKLFYDDVKRHLGEVSNGLRKIEAEIARRGQGEGSTGGGLAGPGAAGTDPHEGRRLTVADANPAQKAILFTAAYFQGLGVSGFNLIVRRSSRAADLQSTA